MCETYQHLIDWVTKMKPGSNSVEDLPQLSHDGHPGHAGSPWPFQMDVEMVNCLVRFSSDVVVVVGIIP
jgi:hypothetical protein